MTKKVTLVNEHTHAGVKSWPGTVVEMEDADADWYNKTVVGDRQAAREAAEESPVGQAFDAANFKFDRNT